MTYVEDWLPAFLARHRMRYRPFDWPEPDTEEEIVYARLWLRAFIERDVTEEEAEEASESLATQAPRYRSDHIPAVIRAVERERMRRRPDYKPEAVIFPACKPDPFIVPEDMTPAEAWRAIALKQGARPEDVNRRPLSRRRRPWQPM